MNEAWVTPAGSQATKSNSVSASKLLSPGSGYIGQGRIVPGTYCPRTFVRGHIGRGHIIKATVYAPFTKICVETRRGGLMLLFIA